MLELSNIEKDTPFTFLRYLTQRLIVHKRERTVCVSKNFLKEGESIVTIAQCTNVTNGYYAKGINVCTKSKTFFYRLYKTNERSKRVIWETALSA